MKILRLKKSNCKNCYRCIRECPVKSIKFSDHQAHIIDDECILCGRCVVTCPQNAKSVIDSTDWVKDAIRAGKRVIAAVAPSFIADFSVTGIGELEASLQKLGFFSAEETAIGAYIVKTEYENMIRAGKQDVIISTCCTSVVRLVQKYYPAAVKYLAHVLSPMQAHAADIKRRYPDAYVVFIGPCIAKKAEGDEDGSYTDAVLTFDELREWAADRRIALESDSEPLSDDHKRSRFFPSTGGIIKSMDKQEGYRYIAVDGVKRCMRALESVLNGDLTHCFLEMSACEGSCIGGPATRKYKEHMLKSEERVTLSAEGGLDFDWKQEVPLVREIEPEYEQTMHPGETEIQKILAQMGKTKPEDELNCGTCGYNTCREKALAVFQGKADVTMCLPFMKEKAESFSNIIIENSPNAIMVLDAQLNVSQLNEAACALFGIEEPAAVLNTNVITLMDPEEYAEVLASEKPILNRKCYLPKYGKYVEEFIIYYKDSDILISILKDITKEEQEAEKAQKMRLDTVEATDRVIDKQMTTVQEIASLLGETVAETKVVLTKLKNTILAEEKRDE